MDKLLLVDGSNLLFQMFYGMPSRIVNTHGKAIHGTLGFTGALLKIIRMVEPSHIAVFFDGEHPNPRAAVDPAYKANRTDYTMLPAQETPFSQLPDVYAALNELNIRHAETTVCETDDWIAACVRAFSQKFEIVISSFDSDFFQLLSPNVSVLRYRGDKTMIWTPKTLMDKFGILPQQYADFKAMTGDSADNIKGAEHIGPKTAAMLLCQFGSLAKILSNIHQIARPRIRESILNNQNQLMHNLQLISLEGDYELPFQMCELAWKDEKLTTSEILSRIGLK